MRRSWRIWSAIALAAVGGCNQVYDIGETDPRMALDTDNDGLEDTEDNCPAIMNEDQNDFDGDGVGDVCDNCPLRANTLQQNDGEPAGDRDEIGDDCDPNPTKGGDCLILIDRFSDASRLAAEWELVHGATDPAPTLQHAGDHIVFEPKAANKPAFMVARVDGARLVGRFSVNIIGDWTPPSTFAEAMAAADVTDVDHHLACGIQKYSAVDTAAYLRFQVSSTMSQVQAGYMSGPPVRSELFVRLAVDRAANDLAGCSVQWGVADGVTNTANAQAALPAGGAGIVAKNDPVMIRAVALYETHPTCPVTVSR